MSFRLAPGLRIELVAAEPQVVDPVSMAFDEDGRLWVVEMRDYPNGPSPGESPKGRICVLDDANDDGRFEKSAVFADGLPFANGLSPWKGGVIVTMAPHVVFLKDTDGDGRADLRRVLFQGFAEQNPQLRVNHPTWGLDNHVYLANGLRGGSVLPGEGWADFHATPANQDFEGRAGGTERRQSGGPPKPVSISGMDFRFDPIQGRYEAISGMGQFGLTFDDWGRRFVCSNRNHIRHIVVADRYIKRNPYLVVSGVAHDVPDHGAAADVFPLASNWTTSSLHTGTFTAACGVTVYAGDLLPPEFRGNSFTCEPTGNLVHRDVLIPEGSTFVGRRAREGVEFLASTDDWFRPVDLAIGPDGALYVVDMYRAVIEHPEFMPEELKNRPDLVDGADRGRIWRVVPEGVQRRSGRPQLSKADGQRLVALLGHPNAWWRTTAQRLLVARQDRSVTESVREMLFTDDRPLARLHAAWTLVGLGALTRSDVVPVLDDAHPGLREHAVRLSEKWIAESVQLQERVSGLASDPDPRVRYQVALSLGEIPGGKVLEPLARIALRGAHDRWTRVAVASSAAERAGALLESILAARGGPPLEVTPANRSLVSELSALVGARREPAEVAGVLRVAMAVGENPRRTTDDSAIDNPLVERWQTIVLVGLADGVARRGGRLGDLLTRLPDGDRAWEPRVTELFQRAAKVAADSSRPPTERVEATRLLAHAPFEAAADTLTALIRSADQPSEVRLAAVDSLAAHRDAAVPSILLNEWKRYTPALRRAVTGVMTRTAQRADALLDEIEAGRILPRELDAQAPRQLLSDRMPPPLRKRAKRLLADALPKDRRGVLQRYRAALELAPNVSNGRQVFEKNCATCHRVAGVGVDVGPDIADTRVRTPEALLEDILNPNGAIDANYVTYTVATRDGRVLTGTIDAETATSITLKRAENQTDVVLRRDIEEMHSNGVSLMPEGLEKDIPLQQMADLIAFLKNWRYLDGAVPLAEPLPRNEPR